MTAGPTRSRSTRWRRFRYERPAMTLLTEGQARSAARRTATILKKSFDRVLTEAAAEEDAFDIFLSYAIRDSELVLGTRSLLAQFGHTVYVDWIDDEDLDRARVSRATATRLKKRMTQCTAMLYLATVSSTESKWMPWELGFFDGFRAGRVAILPISDDDRETYVGREYLGLYPYVDTARDNSTNRERLWVNQSPTTYGPLSQWLKDGPSALRERK